MNSYTELIETYKRNPKQMFGDFWADAVTAEKAFRNAVQKAVYALGFIDFCAANYRKGYADGSMSEAYNKAIESFAESMKADDGLFGEFWELFIESTKDYPSWKKDQYGDWNVRNENYAPDGKRLYPNQGMMKFSDFVFMKVKSIPEFLVEAYTAYRGGNVGANYPIGKLT